MAVEGLEGILGACASRVSECVVGNGLCVDAFLVCVAGVAPNQGSDDTYLGSCWDSRCMCPSGLRVRGRKRLMR